MTELTELAGKYARQVAAVETLRSTVEIARAHMAREQSELDAMADKLKSTLTRERPKALVPIGFNRYVLVHSTNGSFGIYASIEIIVASR